MNGEASDDVPSSLATMKTMMRNALTPSGEPFFTQEEIDTLTDGVALTATQMAIWSCSNPMTGVQFVNSHYVGNPADTATDKSGAGSLGDVPTEKEDETKLMFKLYEYLLTLPPTTTTHTTADTIINVDNFISEMSLSLLEKVVIEETDQETAVSKDSYNVQLSFKPAVVPSTVNGDNLIARVLDVSGNVLAEGRLAGFATAEETYLMADANGYYTFPAFVMKEGDQTFRLSIEGTQNLKDGVYLYTSETQMDEDGQQITSQTMVGKANGKQGVHATMELHFELAVKDQEVATEHYQSTEEPVTPPVDPPVTPPVTPPIYIPPVVTPTNPTTPTTPGTEEPETETPETETPSPETPGAKTPVEETPVDGEEEEDSESELVDIPEEEVPATDKPELAEVPKTGAALTIGLLLYPMTIIALLLGASLAVRKRRK